MATYYNGAAQPQFSNLDGTTAPAEQYSSKAPGRSGSAGRTLGTVCAVIYFVLLTAVAVIAFILGSYATDKVRSFSHPDASLVSDPQSAPAGYSVFSLGTGLGYWSPATSMLHPRSDHGVIAYQKFAYLVGGLSVDDVTKEPNVLKSIVRYDTETGLMYEMRPLPEARCRFGYAQLGGKIYVMGGTDSAADDARPSNLVFVYDIAVDKWANMGQLTTARVDACGAAANGKVYVFGGYDENGISLSTVEVCDPSTATATAAAVCTQLPATSNLIQPRGDCRAVNVGGLIYAVGGAQWYNNTQQNCTANWIFCYRFLKSVEVFNPATGVWSLKAPMISARGDFGIEVLPGGRFVVAGGERGNGTQNSMAMYDVEEYIVQHNVWVQKAPLPEARFRSDLAYQSGRVYVFGGTPTCDLVKDAPCKKVALATVFAYFDLQYPRLYAFYKEAIP